MSEGGDDAETAVVERKGREGSRWINERPSGDDFAAWASENVHVHEGMSVDQYVPGITLIQQRETAPEVVAFLEGDPVIEDRDAVVYTPYAKVETRVKYFWDWMAQNDDWLGAIEPVAPLSPHPTMPDGFGGYSVQDGNNTAAFVTCSMRVRVWERSSITEEVVRDGRGKPHVVKRGKLIIDAPPATKAVPLIGTFGIDPNAIMKAETGAVGRALGLAGILVIPGTGVATAEDVREAISAEAKATATPQPGAEAAQIPDEDGALRIKIAEAIETLNDVSGERLTNFRAWAKEQNLGRLNEATSPQLRTVFRRLEMLIEEARAEAEAAPKPAAE